MIDEHQELITEAFRCFTLFEREVRQVVGEILLHQYGTEWVAHLPASILEECRKRMKEALEDQGGPERGRNLLEYADFSHLTSLAFDHCWNGGFDRWYSDQQDARDRFERLRLYRNALMHSTLSPNECPVFINLSQSMLEELKEGPKVELGTLDSKGLQTLKEVAPIDTDPSTEDERQFSLRLGQILDQMSGLFEGERDAAFKFVEENLQLCTFAVLEELELKFSRLAGTEELVRKFRNKLPPRRPRGPERKKWRLNLKKWFRWAEREYLPYRYWMMANRQFVADIETLSLDYEDWLYESYPALLQKQPHRFTHTTYQHIMKLLEDNNTILWVLVDNLPWYYLNLFLRNLDEVGFGDRQITRQLALLPSTTAISRRSALIGQLPNEIPSSVGETTAFLDAWKSRTDRRTHHLSSLDELEAADSFQAKLLVYVYGRLDKLSHESTTKDFEREAEIEAAISRLVSRIAKSMRRLSESAPAVLVLSTDHGSTYFQPTGRHLQVPSSARKDEEFDQHKRFILTSNSAALNDVEWFYLDKDIFALHESCAVARGWRFIEKRPRGYTHGGLSPEETILPLITCRFGENEFERLAPTYEQATPPLRLGVSCPFSLRVSNPFRSRIEDLEIWIRDFGLSVPSINVEPLMEALTDEVMLALPAKAKVEDDAVWTDIFVRFWADGQEHTQPTKLRIKVRQLFKTDLDEEFGDMF